WASVRPAACRHRAWVARLVAATALDRVAAPHQGGVNLRPPTEPHREATSPGPRPAEPHHEATSPDLPQAEPHQEAAKADPRAAARQGGGSPDHRVGEHHQAARIRKHPVPARHAAADRKSTRLNSSHVKISY